MHVYMQWSFQEEEEEEEMLQVIRAYVQSIDRKLQVNFPQLNINK